MEAADWTRRRLEERWAAVERPDAEEIVVDVQAEVARIPSVFERADLELGCAFSIALVLAHGNALLERPATPVVIIHA